MKRLLLFCISMITSIISFSQNPLPKAAANRLVTSIEGVRFNVIETSEDHGVINVSMPANYNFTMLKEYVNKTIKNSNKVITSSTDWVLIYDDDRGNIQTKQLIYNDKKSDKTTIRISYCTDINFLYILY